MQISNLSGKLSSERRNKFGKIDWITDRIKDSGFFKIYGAVKISIYVLEP